MLFERLLGGKGERRGEHAFTDCEASVDLFLRHVLLTKAKIFQIEMVKEVFAAVAFCSVFVSVFEACAQTY